MENKKKEVTGRGRIQKGSNCIKGKDENILFDENEIKKNWEECVTALYNDTRENPPDAINDESEEIKLSEVEKAIKNLRDRKVPGNDEKQTEDSE